MLFGDSLFYINVGEVIDSTLFLKSYYSSENYSKLSLSAHPRGKDYN